MNIASSAAHGGGREREWEIGTTQWERGGREGGREGEECEVKRTELVGGFQPLEPLSLNYQCFRASHYVANDCR